MLGKSQPPRRPNSLTGGFTLVELLVVIVMIAILAVLLLPAFAKARFPSEVIACKANYHRWCAAATMYASNDARGRLPSWDIFDAPGGNPWDVSTNMVLDLGPYGVTVPMWFCPARPQDFANANSKLAQVDGGIHNLSDLDRALRYSNRGYDVAYQAWWVPRRKGGSDFQMFPYPYVPGVLSPQQLSGTRARVNGVDGIWPRTVSGRTIKTLPILSDQCCSAVNYFGQNPQTDIAETSGHPYAGKCRNINMAYADGHVETRQRALFLWEYMSEVQTTFY